MDFYPSRFFSKFPQFFDPKKPVWEVLNQLHDALLSLKLGKIEGQIDEGVTLIHPELISIGKGTRVESGAYIIGPAFIGENCEIRHGAYLRGDVYGEDNIVIGHATEAKNAIFLQNSQAGHFAYVGNSILGARVNLGAGTKCANLRFDRKNVKIEGIDSGLRKFGAIFGDGAQTGCNVVTNPGTIMEKGSAASPCRSVHGIIS
ncbi:MAG: Bifunctional protein GlmU [Chlamydiales bacterium]|nr:Bifunctional protein GlmU [Chlamydiales bacterium]MCH9619574.1 Bifunctional protein GlmU [Chlamydiales bacterium]MCH9623180.1 Bifunctional protein GlmU [Chlamydiales bacterium]